MFLAYWKNARFYRLKMYLMLLVFLRWHHSWLFSQFRLVEPCRSLCMYSTFNWFKNCIVVRCWKRLKKKPSEKRKRDRLKENNTILYPLNAFTLETMTLMPFARFKRDVCCKCHGKWSTSNSSVHKLFNFILCVCVFRI